MKFVGRIGFLPFRYHILTNSTDIVPINSFYRPVCNRLYPSAIRGGRDETHNCDCEVVLIR